MSIVARKLTDGSTVYWVTFHWQGRPVWERSGTDRRAAERLEKKRRKEVADKTYAPKKDSRATTVGQYLRDALGRRTSRNAENEARFVAIYVLDHPDREWFVSMPIVDVEPAHVLRLVTELRKTIGVASGKTLSAKSVANLYGTIRTAFRAAAFARVIDVDPCASMPKGAVKRKRSRASRRQIYQGHEVIALCTSEAIPPRLRVWNALAFFTGMRLGEVCGRRWRHWDRTAQPLTSLVVDTQYDDRPIKTDDDEDAGEHARLVPVHPALERVLSWWWDEGFEIVYCRKPKADDFIVPDRDGTHVTRSMAYKAWTRTSCPSAGVENRSVHSTRHTFITLARQGGANTDALERVTHNAQGAIIDHYTSWQWEPLCEAVSAFRPDAARRRPDVDQGGLGAEKQVEALGIEPGGRGVNQRNSAAICEVNADLLVPRKAVKATMRNADLDASQRRAVRKDLRVAQSIWSAVAYAQRGEDSACHAEMRRAGRLLGLPGFKRTGTR